MSRSRSFNRFHRHLARQKRRGLRSVLPQYRDDQQVLGAPIDHSRSILSRLNGLEIQLDLQENEA